MPFDSSVDDFELFGPADHWVRENGTVFGVAKK